MYYKIFKISEGISLIQEIYVANFMRCNIWHVRGKEFDLINAPDKESAELIAIKKAEKKYLCHTNDIKIISCNKQN